MANNLPLEYPENVDYEYNSSKLVIKKLNASYFVPR